jgi:hypothetical protein
MIVTGFCFVAVTASVKMVGDDVPAAQAAFLRYALGAIFLLPMIPAVRAVSFHAADPEAGGLAGRGARAWRDLLVLRHDANPDRRGDGDELPQPDLRDGAGGVWSWASGSRCIGRWRSSSRWRGPW